MYENVLKQEKLIQLLTSEIKKSSLPPSVLFFGPTRSGKLTVALETARVLSCENSGTWNCSCEPCRLHRTLDYPAMILTGTKAFLPEILVGTSLLESHPSEARRFFLIRSVKKLVKRYDQILWEGEEQKLKPLIPALESLQDDLEILHPAHPIPHGNALTQLTTRIEDTSRSLAKAVPGSGIPIRQVRQLSSWARSTSAGRIKFVFLENADRMQEAARNALLKILEEPPSLTYFFLLTSQKGAILPTILSRVRPLPLAERSDSEQQEVLKVLFHCQEGEYPDLKTYFQDFETDKQGLFDELALTFLQALNSPLYPLEDRSRFWSDEDNFSSFVEALLRAVSQNRGASLENPERFVGLVQEARIRKEQYNLSAALLIETLFYKARLSK